MIYAIISLTSLAIALYMMQAEIALQLKKTFGFMTIGQGFAKRHYTFTYSEAAQWAACYDVATIYKRGNFVAMKAVK
jgi:hypothetical protein